MGGERMLDSVQFLLRNPEMDSTAELPERLQQVSGTGPDENGGVMEADQTAAARCAQCLLAAAGTGKRVLVFCDPSPESVLLAAMNIRGLQRAGIAADWRISAEIKSGTAGISLQDALEIELEETDIVLLILPGTHDDRALNHLQNYGITPLTLTAEGKGQDIAYPAGNLILQNWELLRQLYSGQSLRQPEDLLPFVFAALQSAGVPVRSVPDFLTETGLEWLSHSIMPCWRLVRTAASVHDFCRMLLSAIIAGRTNLALRYLTEDDELQAADQFRQLQEMHKDQERISVSITDQVMKGLMEGTVSQNHGFLETDCSFPDPVTAIHPAVWLARELNRIVLLSDSSQTVAGFPDTSLAHAAARLLGRNGHGIRLCAEGRCLVIHRTGQDQPGSVLMQAGIHLDHSLPVPETIIDLEIGQDELISESWDEIRELAPFGIGNPEPLFLCRNLKIQDLHRSQEDPENLDAVFSLSDYEGETIQATGTGLGDFEDILPAGITVSAVCRLDVCQQGEDRSLILRLKHLIWEPVYAPGSSIDEDDLYINGLVTIPEILEEYGAEAGVLVPTAAELNRVHRILREMIPEHGWAATDLTLLTPAVATRTGQELTPFKLSRCLEILQEAGVLRCYRLSGTRLFLRIPEETGPVMRLGQTAAYRKMIAQLQPAEDTGRL